MTLPDAVVDRIRQQTARSLAMTAPQPRLPDGVVAFVCCRHCGVAMGLTPADPSDVRFCPRCEPYPRAEPASPR